MIIRLPTDWFVNMPLILFDFSEYSGVFSGDTGREAFTDHAIFVFISLTLVT